MTISKEEYANEFQRLWNEARGQMVGYILAKDGYVQVNDNDNLIRMIDDCFSKLKKEILTP